jgi:hypothetical protein
VHNDGFHTLCVSADVTWVVKWRSRRICVGNVARESFGGGTEG